MFRLTWGNLNNFHVAEYNNESVADLAAFLWVAESDMHGLWEVGLNWLEMPWEARLKEWFRSDVPLRTVAANNTHGQHGRRQYGGTALMAFGLAVSALISVGKDDSGLGCWSWMLLQGANNN